MKRTFLLLFILPLLCSCIMAQHPDTLQKEYASQLTAESSYKHLSVLASAAFEGRGTGEPGGEKAATYIADVFKELELNAPVNGSYFQPVELVRTGFTVSDFDMAGKPLINGKDFYIQGNNAKMTIDESEIVFIGYGISSRAYDDLKGVNIKDKVVLLLNEGEPFDDKGESLVSGKTTASEWSTSVNKRLLYIMSKKPKLILAAHSDVATTLQQSGHRFARQRIVLADKAETSSGTVQVPVAAITPETADEILAKAGTSLTHFERTVKSTKQPQSVIIKTTAKATFGMVFEHFTADNVLGYLEGSDLKDELLVITGHYDHDGIAPDGTIFYGADDNGSGTVGVLELARIFAQAKADGNGPRRSILFVGFTAEEKGLLGSAYYAQNPVFPLENTVANLNLDMIGRIDDKHLLDNHNYIHIIGADKLSSELNVIVREANATYTDMELDTMYNHPKDPMRIYYRSDQYNFAKHGIPVIFFFSGLHPHYHTPEDTIDKIDFPMMAKRIRLVFHTAWEIANRDLRLAVDSDNL